MRTTLVDRVDELVQAQTRRLPAAAPSVSIAELAQRVETLERAIREIAVEVEKLSGSVQVSLLDERLGRRFRRSG